MKRQVEVPIFILGIIGMLFSIKNRNIILSFLNIFLILAFPITMSIGYYF